jgi:hypothetical protein
MTLRRKASVAESLADEIKRRTGEETITSDLTYDLRRSSRCQSCAAPSCAGADGIIPAVMRQSPQKKGCALRVRDQRCRSQPDFAWEKKQSRFGVPSFGV